MDLAIRQALRRQFHDRCSGDLDTPVIEKFVICRGTIRIDLT